jgi:hypothetical protein
MRTAWKLAASISIALFASSCKDEPKSSGDVPPPPPPPATVSSAKASAACASGGGEVGDAVSASFFPKTIAAYCIDPQGETKTYGEKGKLKIEDLPFDGDIEVYKRFGLKRVVTLRYIDGSGKGGNVEVVLSQLADDANAYGFFTFRVVAGDPTEQGAPRVLDAKAQGAIGTGRAYVWRGPYLVELQYNNDQESPDALAKSSESILSALGKDIGDKLPGPAVTPAAARALPKENLITNGVSFATKEPFGVPNLGAAAIGFYKDGDKRWRVMSMATADADQAKDAMKTLKARPGALPIAGVGDEAVQVTTSSGKEAPKVTVYAARKGASVFGVADEEYALLAAGTPDKQAPARVAKDDAIAKLKALLAAAPAAGPTGSTAPSGSAAPAAASSAPSSAPKK